ncbi:Hypothetical protein R9X50_00302500 [Acrodontium crateriforme]|uniref:DNA (cytosine-5-)-methyltransferase n=1 Tax=Acrodontium crateriforme TaxID=150365 RepID=A0AAQ3M379_9PEZI|nr:Hypothetical protein R9X50_00302500 [Acrodontium crateriforme]
MPFGCDIMPFWPRNEYLTPRTGANTPTVVDDVASPIENTTTGNDDPLQDKVDYNGRAKQQEYEDSDDDFLSFTPVSAQLGKRRKIDGDGYLTFNRDMLTANTDEPLTEPKHRSSSISSASDGAKVELHKSRRVLDHINVTGPDFARHRYDGWKPPLPQMKEREVIEKLQTVHDKLHAQDPPEFVYFELNDFSIYHAAGKRQGELVSLDHLNNRMGCDKLFFAGILSCGNQRRYVQDIGFDKLPIDGYGDDEISAHTSICIQTQTAKASKVWYRLGKPSKDYERFHSGFLWLVQLTEHFVDFLMATPEVTLEHFRSEFYSSIQHNHGDNPCVVQWLQKVNIRDFRTNINAHVGFLWKECYSIVDQGSETDVSNSGLCKHPIWGEIDPERLSAIPEQPNLEVKTVVTSYVADCFKHMYFADQLDERAISTVVQDKIKHQKDEFCLTPLGAVARPKFRPVLKRVLEIKRGDVVSFRPGKGKWKAGAKQWFAYVQKVRRNEQNEVILDVLWLYHSCDTTIGPAYYPFPNELFLSDNCDCGRDAQPLSNVTGKVDVTWYAKDPSDISGFFVRQKFRTTHANDEYDFTSLQDSDFRCQHSSTPYFEGCVRKYVVGQTVLVNMDLPQDDCLRPAQIISFDMRREQIQLRQLAPADVNLGRLSDIRPNELILTNNLFRVDASKIIRECHVRYFDQEAVIAREVPAPYNRDGAGDFYYIRRLHESSLLEMSAPSLPPFVEGWDPKITPQPKLRGMGIFCGGGSFDRAFEDAGAVEFITAVDWSQPALHSYRANAKQNPQFFCGSVNDYMAQVLQGDQRLTTPVGSIDIIVGGSPCPGFSVSNSNKMSPQSLRNASLVASVLTFADVYNPRYVVLENVIGMTRGLGEAGDENVFAQIIAALVGLGYQVQQFLLESWTMGSSQFRSRLFIVASLPGTPPLNPPTQTHAHPEGMKKITGCVMSRRLGISSNGLAFGSRRDDLTPFPSCSMEHSIRDLPNISDGLTTVCPNFPDHRLAALPPPEGRTRIAVVPIHPPRMGLVKAAAQGLISGEPLKYIRGSAESQQLSQNKMYTRIDGARLFPTLITSMTPTSVREGNVLHPCQHRVISLMEMRRAQDYPDEEVIVGRLRDQSKEIGNAVNRKSGLALACQLRESWLQLDMSHRTAKTTPGPSCSGKVDFFLNKKVNLEVTGRYRPMRENSVSSIGSSDDETPQCNAVANSLTGPMIVSIADAVAFNESDDEAENLSFMSGRKAVRIPDDK